MAPLEYRSEDSHSHNLEVGAAAEVVLPILATVGICLRYYIRHREKYAFKLDDYFILASLPPSWALWIIWMYIAVAIVPGSVSTIPPQNLTKSLLWLWIHDLCNVACVFLIKLSVLSFYSRAFVTTKTARTWWWGMLLLNAVQFLLRIANIFVTCFPLHNTWDDPFACTANEVFLHKLTLFTESFGLVTEFGLLVFPVPFVWKVHLELNKKLTLCIVFFFGTLTCATQAVRIYVLEAYLFTPSDIGRDVTAPSLVLCALFETSLGTFVICIVAVWAPLRKWIRQLIKGCSPRPASHQSTDIPCGDQVCSFSSQFTTTSLDRRKDTMELCVAEIDSTGSPLSCEEEPEPWGNNVARSPEL